MIGKIIEMRPSNARPRGTARQSHLAHLRSAVVGLTRYVVDADPRALLEHETGILALTDYALAAQMAGIEPGEKVEAFGTRNLVGDDLRSWQAQMVAVASRAPRVKKPLTHIILSLPHGEHWTEPQREEAITIVLQTLGLDRCQTIWAEHANTEHRHLHLSVVRVDRRTGKAAGSAWPIDDLHQSIALIEERQNRSREPNALYYAQGGIVYDAQSRLMVRDARGLYVSGGKTPAESRERLPVNARKLRKAVQTKAREAMSWTELHTALRELGLTYDKTGSGARISMEGKSYKASQWHRSLARGELEQKLGSFTPDPARSDPGYAPYIERVADHVKALRSRRAQNCARIDQWLKSSLKLMPAGTPKPITQAMREEAREAQALLRRAYADAIAAQAKHKLAQDKWQQAGRPKTPDMIEAPALILPAASDGIERSWSTPSQLTALHTPHATHYCDQRGRVQFTDHRLFIVVHASRNAVSIDAALRLGSERWGHVRLHGSAPFVAMASERAGALGITVLPANGEVHAPLSSPPDLLQQPQPNRAIGRTPVPRASQTDHLQARTASSILAEFDSLPLRRCRAPDDSDESCCSGPLTIDLTAVTKPEDLKRLSQVAQVSNAAAIQGLLEEMRRRQLERWERRLSTVRHDPDLGEAAAPDLLPANEQAAIASARNDHDWLHLLAQWQSQRDTRKRAQTRYRKVEASPEPEVDMQAQYEQWQQRKQRTR